MAQADVLLLRRAERKGLSGRVGEQVRRDEDDRRDACNDDKPPEDASREVVGHSERLPHFASRIVA